MKWTTAALEGVPAPEDDWPYWLEHGYSEDQQERAIRLYDPAGSQRADADFLAAHWHLLEDAERYSCDAFDAATRQCTAHENRPPVCRDYPWYGGEPSAERAVYMGKQCSYLADLPPDQRPEGARPLIPLMPA